MLCGKEQLSFFSKKVCKMNETYVHLPQPGTGEYQVVSPLYSNCIPNCYLNIIAEQLPILFDVVGMVSPNRDTQRPLILSSMTKKPNVNALLTEAGLLSQNR
jgi:hypothetical protein